MDYISVLQSGTSRKLIDSIVDDVFSTPENLIVIFELIFHDDIKIAWKAAWAIEKIVRKYPKLINSQQQDRIEILFLRTKHSGLQRILMSILYALPVQKKINVDILNTCFDIVSSDKYSIAVQSLALKILVNYCTIEKELIPELEAYLESMDEYILAPAMLSSKRFALKALSKSR